MVPVLVHLSSQWKHLGYTVVLQTWSPVGWRDTHPIQLAGILPELHTLDDKKLYGCCSCRSLHIFDSDSKEQGTVDLKLRRSGTWDPQYVDISHDGKHVYVTEEKRLLCFNVSDGSFKWENCDDFLDPRGVACYQQCVYVADGNKNKIIELFQSDGTKTNEHGEYLDKPIAIHISESTSGRFVGTQHREKVKK